MSPHKMKPPAMTHERKFNVNVISRKKRIADPNKPSIQSTHTNDSGTISRG